MKFRAVNWLLFLALVGLLVSVSGCATDPDNASIRPWNSPQGWQQNGALGGMDYQRH